MPEPISRKTPTDIYTNYHLPKLLRDKIFFVVEHVYLTPRLSVLIEVSFNFFVNTDFDLVCVITIIPNEADKVRFKENRLSRLFQVIEHGKSFWAISTEKQKIVDDVSHNLNFLLHTCINQAEYIIQDHIEEII